MALFDAFRSLAARAYVRASRAPRLSVATFHRFGRLTGIGHEAVEHHLQFMARHFDVTLPRDLQSRKKSGVRRLGIVTVDDCHRDIYEYLYPVACALNVPFVICVPTDYFLRRQWLWFDFLYWMLDRAPRGAGVRLDGKLLKLGSKADVMLLKRRLKTCLSPQRNALLAEVSRQLGLVPPEEPRDGFEAVTESEMREMLQSGLVEICAHTVSHTIATVLPRADLDRELSVSKRELEAFAGCEIPSFCYPNGERGDFSDETTESVRRAGFRLAFTSVSGDNPLDENPYLIRRVHAHAKSSVFERDISGLVNLQNAITRRSEV